VIELIVHIEGILLFIKNDDIYVYRVRREKFDAAHRKVDGIEMNIKVPYHLAIFAIIIEILIFEIVLMRARRVYIYIYIYMHAYHKK